MIYAVGLGTPCPSAPLVIHFAPGSKNKFKDFIKEKKKKEFHRGQLVFHPKQKLCLKNAEGP